MNQSRDKRYVIPAVVQLTGGRWRASVPDLDTQRAVAYGGTPEEALRNLQDVTQLVVDELSEGERTMRLHAREFAAPVVVVHCHRLHAASAH